MMKYRHLRAAALREQLEKIHFIENVIELESNTFIFTLKGEIFTVDLHTGETRTNQGWSGDHFALGKKLCVPAKQMARIFGAKRQGNGGQLC